MGEQIDVSTSISFLQVEFHTFEVMDDTTGDIFVQNGIWTLESFVANNLRPLYNCCPFHFTEIQYILRLRSKFQDILVK